MIVTLPDDIQDAATRRARDSGFATVGEYVADLIRRDQADEDAARDQLTPTTFQTREELERLLDAATGDGWRTADDAFWAERRRVLMERLAAKKGAAT